MFNIVVDNVVRAFKFDTWNAALIHKIFTSLFWSIEINRRAGTIFTLT